MPLPSITIEGNVVFEPEIRFNDEGKPWTKVRVVSKDRFYNRDTSQWEDRGDPCYLDVLLSGAQAEHVCDSVLPGDAVLIKGVLKQREYEKDGQTIKVYEVRSDFIGVGILFGPAPSPKMQESKGMTGGGSARATAVTHTSVAAQSEEAPF